MSAGHGGGIWGFCWDRLRNLFGEVFSGLCPGPYQGRCPWTPPGGRVPPGPLNNLSRFKLEAEKGFSLIEVLAALAVLAIVLGAVVKSTGAYARNTAYLMDRTMAHWVAMNVLAETRLKGGGTFAGESEGEEKMVGKSWYWRLTVSETQEPSVRRLEVKVSVTPGRKETMATLQGFMGRE